MGPGFSIEEGDGRLHARSQSACFVCGQDNTRGLRLQYRRGDGGDITAEWTPDAVFEGFCGIVHGGVVSTVLDEAMSKAVSATGTEALTAEIRVRFRRPVATGGRFRIHGWIVRRNKRLIEAEATLRGTDGAEHAHAWARFLSLPGQEHETTRAFRAVRLTG